MTQFNRGQKGPLDGIRILDLTWMLAGPYCTMLLADLGADVIKVEKPEGDPIRAVPPFFPDDKAKHFGGFFQSINRNKRSIVLDLKTADGKRDFLILVTKCDALVENYRAGVMDKLGLGYEALHEVNPKLVYAALRGFGDPRTGATELNGRPAMDYIVQAMSGIMSITGPEAGPPMKVGPGVGDIFPGSLTALGVVSAILNTRSTGQGQFVDVAMYDSCVSLCERIVYQYSYTNETPRSKGNGHPLFSLYNTLEAKDGHVCISATFDHEWVRLANAIGQPELATDPRFATADARLANDDAAIEAVSVWTRTRTRAEIMAELGDVVPAGPVQTAKDLYEDPHLKKRQMIVELEHPGSAHRARVAGAPIKFSSTPGGVRLRAPLLGEHSGEIRSELLFGVETKKVG